MIKVLVTGAAGFLGKFLVPELLANNVTITALVRRSSNISHLNHPNINLIFGDITDNDLLNKIVPGIDAIIHAAATFSGSKENFYSVNVQATENLLQLASQFNVRKFIYISSISVYRHSAYKTNQVITEDYPYERNEFHTQYSLSKMQAEQIVKRYNDNSNVKCTIIRPGSLYGPYGPFFPARTGLALGNERIILIGNTHSHIPIAYTKNVAMGIVQCLIQENNLEYCYNIVDDEPISRIDYINSLRKKVNPEIKAVRIPLWFLLLMKFCLRIMFHFLGKKAPLSDLSLKMYASSYVYSNEKIKKLVGNSKWVDSLSGLNETFSWLKLKITPKRSTGIINGRVQIQSDKKLRVGIIGCGVISKVHLKKIKEIPNVEEIILCDPNKDALDSIKSQFSVSKGYSDYREMIKSERPNVVHVLTPPQYHAEVAIFAAQNKCHVLVEKPMSVNRSQAERMVQAAANHQVKLCVMHNHLYDDVMLQARNQIAQGAVGKITYIESWYGIQFKQFLSRFTPGAHWKYNLPGSVYQDYLPHAMYALTDFVGDNSEIKVTHAITKYAKSTPAIESDELKVLLETNDIVGLVNVSLSNSPRQQFLKIYGTKGEMIIDFLNQYVFLNKAITSVPKTVSRIIASRKYGKMLIKASHKNFFNSIRGKYELYQGTGRIIQLFYRSILLDEKPPVTGNEGLQLMNIMDEIWKRTGQAN